MSILPWDNLQDYVHDWMKGLQVIADSIAPDPVADNSMLAFTSLPYSFDCTFYASITTSEITDNYSGSQPWLISYRVVLMNNSLRIVNQKYVGKNVMDGIDKWGQLTDAEKATIENEVNAMYSARNIEVVNNYPNLKLVTLGGQYGTISIYPRGHSSDGIQIKFPTKNDGFKTRSQAVFGATMAHLPEINSEGYYEPNKWSADYSAIGGQNDYSLYGNIIAVFDNDTEASRVVNAIGHSPYNAHNDVINYTKSGSEYKLYYGDNYLIYALNENKIYNYHDLFTGTKQATDRINNWNPTAPPIKTPTYNEVKHEDDPSGDDPWHGVDFEGSSGGGGNFARFYYMTSTELANLRTWMSSNNVPEGFNPMAQIIGLSQVPVAINGSAPENVMFINSSAIYSEGQNRVVDSGVATQRGSGNTIVYNLGSVEIPRRMQQRGEPYLDYSCAIELYLPFCGVFSLDTQAVMGRTITAQLVLDPTSGTVTGYAWVENEGQKLPVAYGSGQVGVDLPITAQQYGMSKAALTQANAQFAQSMFQTAIQAMIYAATSGMSSAESAGDAAYRGGRGSYGAVRNAEKGALANEVGTYVKSQASSNVVGGFLNWGRALKEISYGNNTAVNGSFGGSYASWSNPFTAYVKIIRPKFQKPDNYNHTQAVPCVEAKTVGSCTGLIQCIGVDTSSITNATSIERDAIAAALSNGVYAGIEGDN